MKMKKCLSMILAIVMIATMITSLPITANAVDVDTAGVGVDANNIFYVPSTETPTMQAAKSKIEQSGAGEYVIELVADINDNGNITISGEGKTVTIIGNDHCLCSSVGQNVNIWDGAKVILGDGVSKLTLKGGVYEGGDPGVVYIVGEKSRCEMNDGVTIKDNQTSAYFVNLSRESRQ